MPDSLSSLFYHVTAHDARNVAKKRGFLPYFYIRSRQNTGVKDGTFRCWSGARDMNGLEFAWRTVHDEIAILRGDTYDFIALPPELATEDLLADIWLDHLIEAVPKNSELQKVIAFALLENCLQSDLYFDLTKEHLSAEALDWVRAARASGIQPIPPKEIVKNYAEYLLKQGKIKSLTHHAAAYETTEGRLYKNEMNTAITLINQAWGTVCQGRHGVRLFNDDGDGLRVFYSLDYSFGKQHGVIMTPDQVLEIPQLVAERG